MKPLILIFAFGIISIPCFGQKFYCDAEKEVVNGSTFEVQFIIEDGTGSNLQLPQVSGAKLIGGPSQSSQVSIINGQRSSEVKYIYTYLAQIEGTIAIGSAKVNINNKIYTSQPISIRAISASKAATILEGSNGDFIVKQIVTSPKAFVGQQICVEYILYYNAELQINQIISESDYSGFFSNRIESNSDQNKQIKYKNKVYNSTVFHRVALFPQKSGVYKIDPLVLSINIPKQNARPRGLFGYREMESKTLTSNATTVTIIETPTPSPVSFSGAVGEYEMHAAVDKNSLETGQAITLQMELKGDGDKRLVRAPELNFGKDFEMYKPTTIGDEETVEQGKIVHIKKFEYILIPKKEGKYHLKPVFSYFNPPLNKYNLITSDSFEIHVSQGKGPSSELSKTTSQESEGQSSSNSKWIYVSLIPLFSGIFFFVYYRRRNKQISDIDQINVNKQIASKKINKHLKEAKLWLDKGDEKKMYNTLSRSLNEYLYLKFNIPNELQNKDFISTKIKEIYGEDESERYIDLLNSCEAANYGFGLSTPAHSLYDKVKNLMEHMETLKNDK